MVLFTAIWIFWNKSACHDLLKITVVLWLLINWFDHKSQKHISQMSTTPENCASRQLWSHKKPHLPLQALKHSYYYMTLRNFNPLIILSSWKCNRIDEGYSSRWVLRSLSSLSLAVTMDTVWCDTTRIQRTAHNTEDPQIYTTRDTNARMRTIMGISYYMKNSIALPASIMKSELSSLRKKDLYLTCQVMWS